MKRLDLIKKGNSGNYHIPQRYFVTDNIMRTHKTGGCVGDGILSQPDASIPSQFSLFRSKSNTCQSTGGAFRHAAPRRQSLQPLLKQVPNDYNCNDFGARNKQLIVDFPNSATPNESQLHLHHYTYTSLNWLKHRVVLCIYYGCIHKVNIGSVSYTHLTLPTKA